VVKRNALTKKGGRFVSKRTSLSTDCSAQRVSQLQLSARNLWKSILQKSQYHVRQSPADMLGFNSNFI